MRSDERSDAARVLGPALFRTFAEMSRPWQRHHLDVYATLRDQGQTDRELLQAALLHDVGKGRLGLAYRVLVVILRATARPLLQRLAEGADWCSGFRVDRDHPFLGAQLAAAAGAPPAVVDIIARHHQPPGADVRLAVLQAADGDR